MSKRMSMDKLFLVRREYNAIDCGEGGVDYEAFKRYINEECGNPLDSEIAAVWSALNFDQHAKVDFTTFSDNFDVLLKFKESLRNPTLPRSPSLQDLIEEKKVSKLKDQFEDEEEKKRMLDQMNATLSNVKEQLQSKTDLVNALSKSCIGQASIEEDVTTGLNISELKKQLHDIASPPRNRSPHAVRLRERALSASDVSPRRQVSFPNLHVTKVDSLEKMANDISDKTMALSQQNSQKKYLYINSPEAELSRPAAALEKNQSIELKRDLENANFELSLQLEHTKRVMEDNERILREQVVILEAQCSTEKEMSEVLHSDISKLSAEKISLEDLLKSTSADLSEARTQAAVSTQELADLKSKLSSESNRRVSVTTKLGGVLDQIQKLKDGMSATKHDISALKGQFQEVSSIGVTVNGLFEKHGLAVSEYRLAVERLCADKESLIAQIAAQSATEKNALETSAAVEEERAKIERMYNLLLAEKLALEETASNKQVEWEGIRHTAQATLMEALNELAVTKESCEVLRTTLQQKDDLIASKEASLLTKASEMREVEAKTSIQLEQMERQLKDKQDNIAVVEHGLQQLQETYNAALAQQQADKQHTDSARHTLEVLCQEKSTHALHLEVEIQELQKKLSASEAAKSELFDKLDKFTLHALTAEGENKHLRLQLSELESRLSSQTAESANAQGVLQDARVKLVETQLQLETLQVKQEGTEQALLASEATVSDLQAIITERQEAQNKTSSDLDELKKAHEELQTEIDLLTENLKEKEAKIVDITHVQEGRVTALACDLEDVKHRNVELLAEVVELERKLGRANGLLDDHQKAHAEQYLATDASVQNLQATVRQLSEEKAKVAAELIKEQEHLHAMETAIVSQQEQLKEAECQREKLHGELTDLHSKYKELTTKLKNSSAQNTQLINTISELETSNKTLQESFDSVTRQFEISSQELDNTCAEYQTFARMSVERESQKREVDAARVVTIEKLQDGIIVLNNAADRALQAKLQLEKDLQIQTEKLNLEILTVQQELAATKTDLQQTRSSWRSEMESLEQDKETELGLLMKKLLDQEIAWTTEKAQLQNIIEDYSQLRDKVSHNSIETNVAAQQYQLLKGKLTKAERTIEAHAAINNFYWNSVANSNVRVELSQLPHSLVKSPSSSSNFFSNDSSTKQKDITVDPTKDKMAVQYGLGGVLNSMLGRWGRV